MNLSIGILETIWLKNPLGIAVISKQGNVLAVNHAFEKKTDLSAAEVIGLTEAHFDALICNISQRSEKTHHRIELMTDDVRAIYYLGDIDNQTPPKSNAAELIREPLSSIYGFAELLLTQTYDEQTRLMLTNTMLEQINVLSGIVNETLEDNGRGCK